MRVGVTGAGGKMGREVCRAVLGRPGLDLVAAVDPHYAGSELSSLVAEDAGGVKVDGEFGALAAAGADVVVDFTRAGAARVTLAACAAAGIHAVVGTTGFTDADLVELAGLFGGPPNCIVAANFSIGAVLLMRFAEEAAAFFEGAEIVELHHDGKVDAPSGTAMRTAERIAAGRAAAGAGAFAPDRTTTVLVEGARGGGGPGGVRVHSVRLPGLVAHEEVIFGTLGQTLTLRHDSYDRASFMGGVVMAIEGIERRPGLTLGLEPLLDL